MNIVFCSNDNYIQYCAVSLYSLFENNKDQEIFIHILIDKISETNKIRIEKIVTNYKGSVSFYLVDNSQFAGLNLSWSVYAWYRCIIPDLLPESVDRILYLDADTCVVGKIDDLFGLDMTNKAVAAITDVETLNQSTFDRLSYPKSDLYFCSGVLVMNLKYWREHTIKDKVFSYAKERAEVVLFPDQDPLNFICRACKIHLPLKYGILENFVLNKEFISAYREEIIDLLEDPRIVHYAGMTPWIIEINRHFMRDEFLKYSKMAGEIDRRHLYGSVNMLKHYIKLMLAWVKLKKYEPYWKVPLLTRRQIQRKISEPVF